MNGIGWPKSVCVEQLTRMAERILEAARLAPDGSWTVLITHAGQTQMLAANDWPLESLLLERGAAMAFRVQQQVSAVVVEGRSLSARCRLEAARPFPFPIQRPAETPRLLPARWG